MVHSDSDANRILRLNRRLSARERCVLDAARLWCDVHAAPLYLVGGSVRDLLLDRAHLDVDLAIDGDAPALGRELGRAFGVEAAVHEHFGTATVVGDGWSFDLSRTRSERYTYAGALPVVSPAVIAADLHRRDFTAHAIALELTGETAGALIDPLDGIGDLNRRLLRVIHDESFRDDPTRILRLARYAVRLQFSIDPETERLARRDATYLGAVSPARIAHELERTFAEPHPEEPLALLGSLHALRPIVRISEAVATAFARLRADGCGPPGMAEYLVALAATLDRAAAEQAIDRLELRQHELAALRACREAMQVLQRFEREPTPDPVAVVDAFAALPTASLRGAGAAIGAAAGRMVSRCLREWQAVRPVLRGDELARLGVPIGPAVGEMLKLLRNGTLRGELTGRESEERFVRERLKAGGGGEEA
ncbi:MAG: CCA tRNA nucleotidyltransferase [Dehalococcoidia bacterium]